jgi:ribose transport system permease protein
VEKICTRTGKPFHGVLRKILQTRELSLIVLLAMIVIALMSSTSTFATSGNIRVLLQGMSVDMMIAIPMAISLIAGNIDFSVGSNLCLSSAIVGLALNGGLPAPVAVLIGLLSGATFGFLNGVIINKLGVTPLVATLGTWMAYRGIALVIIGGQTLSNFGESFTIIGRATWFGIPSTIVYMFAIIAVGIFIIKYTSFFHNAYLIGSNKLSARLAGINIEKFVYISYMITGAVAAFAGIVLAARLGSSSQNAGTQLEFRNVVGLLVGGISMDGGEGKLIGAVLGVTLMQLINNAIVLLYLNASYTQVITGGILILAVAVDQLSKRRKVAAK